MFVLIFKIIFLINHVKVIIILKFTRVRKRIGWEENSLENVLQLGLIGYLYIY